MLWFLLCPLVFILVFRWWRSDEEYRADSEGENMVESIALSIICFFIAGVFAYGLGTCVFESYPDRWECVEKIELRSMGNSEGLQGSFFLGCGSINTVSTFHYYGKYDGYFKKEWLGTAKAIIYEEIRTDGELRIYHWKAIEPNPLISIKGRNYERTARYEFHIPEGSIAREFDLR